MKSHKDNVFAPQATVGKLKLNELLGFFGGERRTLIYPCLTHSSLLAKLCKLETAKMINQVESRQYLSLHFNEKTCQEL